MSTCASVDEVFDSPECYDQLRLRARPRDESVKPIMVIPMLVVRRDERRTGFLPSSAVKFHAPAVDPGTADVESQALASTLCMCASSESVLRDR